jgi:hypothetical protein
MAVVEQLAVREPERFDAAIVDATIIEPKIVDGKIVDGRIVGGRLIHTEQIRHGVLQARNIDVHHFHTELIAIVGLGMVVLLFYLI